MTTRINVSSLVKSASAYAQEKAAKADVSGDSLLSPSETKHLPNDLRDNLARMRAAHPRTKITVDSFASSFRGYVAAAANRADKNKDGFLTPSELKTLPANLRDNVEKLAKMPTTPGPTPAPATGTQDTLGGESVTKLTQSAKVAALNKSLSLADDWHFFGETYKVAPATLKAMLADPEKNKAFLNDLLFHASDSIYLKYPDYYGPTGLTATPRPVSAGAGDLEQTLADGGAFTSLGKDKYKVEADLAAVQQHLSAGGATKALNLSWTNHDDANFYAFATFNEKTGEVRIAGWYPEV